MPATAVMEDYERPKNLEEFQERTKLSKCAPTFELKLDDDADEEIWVINFPRTINPENLKGHSLSLKGRASLKIEEKDYSAVNNGSGDSVTCVCTDDSENVKIVNIKPKGTINVRRKL